MGSPICDDTSDSTEASFHNHCTEWHMYKTAVRQEAVSCDIYSWTLYKLPPRTHPILIFENDRFVLQISGY